LWLLDLGVYLGLNIFGFGRLPGFTYFGTALTAGHFLKLIWEPNALVELEKDIPTLT